MAQCPMCRYNFHVEGEPPEVIIRLRPDIEMLHFGLPEEGITTTQLHQLLTECGKPIFLLRKAEDGKTA